MKDRRRQNRAARLGERTQGERWRKALHTYLERHGLSQNQLALRLGVTRGMVSAWLRSDGPRDPSQKSIQRAARPPVSISSEYVNNGHGGMFVDERSSDVDLAAELTTRLRRASFDQLRAQGLDTLRATQIAIDASGILDEMARRVAEDLQRSIGDVATRRQAQIDANVLGTAVSLLVRAVAMRAQDGQTRQQLAASHHLLLNALDRLSEAANRIHDQRGFARYDLRRPVFGGQTGGRPVQLLRSALDADAAAPPRPMDRTQIQANLKEFDALLQGLDERHRARKQRRLRSRG